MARDLIAGACSYAIFFLIAAHPFLDIQVGAHKMEAQEITNWLTTALAIATVWLGAETRRMAVAAKASIDLESRPYLSFRGFLIKIGTLQDLSNQNTGAFRLALRLFNPGKVLVTYKVESMLISVNGSAASNPSFDTMGAVIHPSDEMLFFYPIVASPTPIKTPATAEVEYHISYWSIPAEKKNLSAKVRVLITSESDHEWTYLEGPNYA